jgi:hypothetical protein
MTQTVIRAEAFAVGDKVFLRGCAVGQHGAVLRLERGKPDAGRTN